MEAPTFLNDFLSSRDLIYPDTRPLYAYRCEEREFKQISYNIKNIVSSANFRDRLGPKSSALFCLFASEWWRREYEGGPWSWDPILETANLDISHQRLYEIVRLGLDFWKRKLIRKTRTEYLISLACEGGLPLRIVQRENTGLQRFFKKLLQKYTDYGQSGVSAARLAAEVGNLLPTSLQTSEVFHLAGSLVESVIDLKCSIPSDTAPSEYIEVLDRILPRWRNTLPLNLDDEIASSFFNDLVSEVDRIQTFRCQQIKYHRYLERIENGWELFGEFNIPNKLPFFYLKEMFNHDLREVSRFYLALKTNLLNDRTIAKLAKQTTGDQVVYRVDKIPKTSTLEGQKAVTTTQLVINSQDGFSAKGMVPEGGSIEDVPWIFTGENEDKLVLIRTGS